MRIPASAVNQDELATTLEKDYGLKNMNDEEKFYLKYKISRKDFIMLLKDNADSVQQTINSVIFEKGESAGRNGVQDLKTSLTHIRKNVLERERLNKFAEKYGKMAGMSAKQFRESGGFKGNYDLI